MDQKRLEFPFISWKHMQNLYTINQALVEKLGSHTEQKRSFLLRISSLNVTKSAGTEDLVTFTEKLFMENFIFFCAVLHGNSFNKQRPWKKVN